ncbi:MAG: hypothetical protein R3F29_00065 [Planctomycetota bacterium]
MPRLPALSFAALLSLPALLPAQKLQSRDFVIPGSQNLLSIDLAATRKLGVWDDLEASVLKVAFTRIEKEMRFPLDALDRFEVSAWLPPGGDPADGKQVLVWVGNRELSDESMKHADSQPEQVGDYVVHRRSRSRGDELIVKVRPELMVFGSAEFIEATLLGKSQAAPMSPDLMSLLSGREGRVAWFVIDLAEALMRERFLQEVMGADLAGWPEEDRPTHLSVQVLVTGDEDDPHLQLRAILRHVKEGDGVGVSQQAFDGMVAKLREDPRMRMIQSLLKKAAATRDHTDAVLQVDLGRSRDAVGNIAALLLPVIGRGAEVEAQAPKPAAEAPAGGDGK